MQHTQGQDGQDKTFVKNVFALVGGTAFASGLIMLAEPITSRFFLPESFGTAAAFYSGATILGIISCLRYEMALVLPDKEEDARSLFILCTLILFAVTVLTAIATWAAGPSIAGLLNMEGLLPALWLFPFAVFLTGLDYLLRRWHSRYKRFNCIALSRTFQAVPRVPAEIIGGMLGYTHALYLILFRILGLIGPNINMFRCFFKMDRQAVFTGSSLAGLIKNAKRYIKFPLFETLSTLLMIISFHAPTLLIASFFGAMEAGYFAKAFYLLFLPTFLVAESTSQVFLQYSAAIRIGGHNLSGVVEVVLKRMFNFGLLPFALIALIGPEIFTVALGRAWSEAGLYAQLMVPWLFAVLLNNSIITLFGVLERQGIGLVYNSFLLFFRIMILVAGGTILRDIHLTLLYFSLGSALIIFVRCLHLITIVQASSFSIGMEFARNILYALPSLLVVVYVKWWIAPSSFYLVFAGIMSSLLYLALLSYFDRDLRIWLINKLSRLKAS